MSPRRIHPRIIVAGSAKGGVGKSTTAVSLSAALARRDRRVLLVDLDPQGSATTSLGLRVEGADPTIYEALVADDGALGPVSHEARPNLDVVPADRRLANALSELPRRDMSVWQLRLAELLAADDHDFVVIDTQATLGALTINALSAADAVIVPTTLEASSWRMVGDYLDTIARLRGSGAPGALNPHLRLFGVLPTFVDLRKRIAKDLWEILESERRFRVLSPPIHVATALEQSVALGRTIFELAPRSQAAEAYAHLAEEVLDGIPG